MLRRWSDFRRRQRETLRASNTPNPRWHDTTAEPEEATGQSLLTDTLPLGADRSVPNGPSGRRDYGTAGRPLNRQSPFYVGFVGAFGVFVAYGLYRALGQLTQVLTMVIVAFFMSASPLLMASPMPCRITGTIGTFSASAMWNAPLWKRPMWPSGERVPSGKMMIERP